MKKIITLSLMIFICIAFLSCEPKKTNADSNSIEEIIADEKSEPVARKFPNALKNGKIFFRGTKKMMYGGEDSTWNFEVTNSILKDENFHYGIGREEFKALIKPEYITISEAELQMTIQDTTRFLVVNINGDSRAYSIELLTKHEVINDVVGGEPIMAVYCVLADLGAIYKRTIGGKKFTFALSGYTYHDKNVWNDLDGFVLWDRETESIWWPLIGKSVSGSMLHTKLTECENEKWEDTTWGDIKKKYKNVKILKPGQSMLPPNNWQLFSKKEISDIKKSDSLSYL